MTVAILGGGLAGVNAARLLHRAGVGFNLFEARDRLGGRILTVNSTGDATGVPSEDGFDLGPSWFWPLTQPIIGALAEELGLPSFAQNSVGDIVFERMAQEKPQRYPEPLQGPQSMRLVGGAASIIRALAQDLPSGCVHLGMPVSGLELLEDHVILSLPDRTVTATHVIATLPPRVMQATLCFSPTLPPETDNLWRDTPTWMAPHAKFFALYDRPFWREAGLSGAAQSMIGPMHEIHDATTATGGAALFGFIKIGAEERQRLDQSVLSDACIAQLGRLFGHQAATPHATLYKDWATDPLTATSADARASDHAEPAAAWVHGLWKNNLILAGSETSPNEAGYLAGAVEASTAAVARVLECYGSGRQ